jgi:hypothetical protein
VDNYLSTLEEYDLDTREIRNINKRISLMEIPQNHGPIILKDTLMELLDELKAHLKGRGYSPQWSHQIVDHLFN